MQDLERIPSNSLKGALEALLLVSTDAVPATTFAQELGVEPSEAASALAELAAEYHDANRGFQLREVSGGWRLFTHPAYHDEVEAYVRGWDTRRLSQAALETLAVIAYHQPVTREGVKAVRGVNSDGVIASLKEKRLIREVGREGDRGGAALFGTTTSFLEKFGLKSLRELPPLEDFAPDEEAKQFIRERLSGRSIGSTLEEAAADLDEEAELLADDALEEEKAELEAAEYAQEEEPQTSEDAEKDNPDTEEYSDEEDQPATDWVSEDLAGDDDDDF